MPELDPLDGRGGVISFLDILVSAKLHCTRLSMCKIECVNGECMQVDINDAPNWSDGLSTGRGKRGVLSIKEFKFPKIFPTC